MGYFSNERFFSSSLGDSDQEAHAAKTVRNILKEIIKMKKIQNLMDEEISKVFKDKGN